MIAYEWETTVESNVIQVDPKLNGKHVRVVVMVTDDAGDSSSQFQQTSRREALTELLKLPSIHLPEFKPFRRDELYDRQ